MKIWILVLTISVLFSASAFSQGTCALIDPAQAPHYISFDHIEEHSSADRSEAGARVWLRIRNNTTCTILMRSVMEPENRKLIMIKLPNNNMKVEYLDGPIGVPPDGAPVELSYRLQDSRMRKAPFNATFNHVVFDVRLLPERSVIFYVPLKHFRKGLHVNVPFNYEWEFDKKGIMWGDYKVFHEAYFFNDYLPKDVIGKTK